MAEDRHQTSRPGATPPHNVPPHRAAPAPARGSSTPIVAIVALVALALLAVFVFKGRDEGTAPPAAPTSSAPASGSSAPATPGGAPAASTTPAAPATPATPAAPTANGDANPPVTAPIVPETSGQDQPGQPTPNSAHTQSGAGGTSPSTSPVDPPKN